jgi:D-alanyl-lipoteichoic acid acyltransferase DltB (MBOAT superfamily)
MVFSSVEFLVFFLPALIVCYFCTPKKFTKCRNLILLLFSLGFYSYGGVKFLGLLFVSIAINYVAALWVNPERSIKVRKTAVALAAVGNLALLFYFKYTGFFAEVLNGMGCHLPVPEIILPIGISFYTFQGLSYVVDVYREQAAVQKNPLWVALYIAFFPQLVAGPIVRYVTVAEEIEKRHESVDEFYQGLVRFLFGFSKKMLLANSMGEVADAIFALPAGNMATSLAWVGAVAYTFQIYFDFSAYSDMAIGLGRMFGFHFEENFKYPYISRSITELGNL